MSDKKIGFLTEGDGSPSSTRLIAILVVIAALVLVGVSLAAKRLTSEVVTIAVSWVALALGAKVANGALNE